EKRFGAGRVAAIEEAAEAILPAEGAAHQGQVRCEPFAVDEETAGAEPIVEPAGGDTLGGAALVKRGRVVFGTAGETGWTDARRGEEGGRVIGPDAPRFLGPIETGFLMEAH